MANSNFNPNILYGLIIGNDSYPSSNDWYSLKGAVNDANNFMKFLSEKLKVPNGNLTLKLNSTREETISAFKELQSGNLPTSKGPSIPISKGSTFVLFYAGHGGRTRIPEGWRRYHTADGQVEQLVPTDIGKKDGNEIVTGGIPDRTVAAVLNGLVRKIGDNVIVILDCCHSAGQTRGPRNNQNGDSVRPRCLPNLPPLGNECDADIISGENTEVGLSRAMRGGIGELHGNKNLSYILLAACQQDQLAGDAEYGGLFTTKLLSILQSQSLTPLTYAGLMLKMKMPNQLCVYANIRDRIPNNSSRQTPVCFGPNQNRIIFTTKEGKQMDDCFIGEFSEHWASDEGSDPIPIVFGGLAHGICKGDKFKLYDISEAQKCIGVAKVVNVFSTCAKLSTEPGMASNTNRDPFYCRLIRDYSTMKVFCDSTVNDLLSKINTEDVKFGQAPNPEDATIIITNDKRRSFYVELSFRPGCIGDKNIFMDGIGARFTDTIPKDHPEKIRAVLTSMFRFYNLLNTCKSVPDVLEDIDVKFIRVKEAPNEVAQGGVTMDCTRYPDNSTFCHSMKDQGDVVTISARRSHQCVEEKDIEYYGLSITNNTNEHLFVYVLRFDSGEMRIDPWHSSTFHTPDIPFYQHREERPEVASEMKPGATLAIGYGNSDVDPISFIIDNGIEADRTYFKIILTTSPADFSMLIQTHNPLRRPSRADPSMARSNTARSQNLEYRRAEAVQYAKDEQRARREDEYYYSVNFTVHQIPR